MIEKINYISDDELEHLINQVEQEELVAAPPDLVESILEAVEQEEKATSQPVPVKRIATKRKEFYAYSFRVITSVAAAIALVFLLPGLTDRMSLDGMPVAEPVNKRDVVEKIPAQAEVVKKVPVQADVVQTVPEKATIVVAGPVPSKEEVLNDTGFIEKVVNKTIDWISKESNEF